MPRQESQTNPTGGGSVEAPPHNLGDLLQRIAEVASDREDVYLATIMEALGTRSFGPVVLLVGLVMVSPLSGIPGLPTTMAIGLLLISMQLMFGRESFWLPGWLMNRHLSSGRVQRTVRWLDRPARFIDWWLRPRFCVLASNGGAMLIAGICTVLALIMPVLELVPFSTTAVGIAVVAFGLALVALDGLFVLMGLAYLLIVAGLAVTGFTVGG
ncbi:exopolysaccharide biosynthesis protein [Guyparkeria hydrothermalis]|uniref:exopolysaccharide biosynthesis protein n=1 Tax=Guyparkeria hydrothermalis TaxID=923 RepID=UPI002021903E|nr:exopolysaccharide biosynthesis protein [Guyparkeria hydrothermalis]MCL7743846.1 exopolysaccharide biosynthesis protein [Guyparkeria hydrothermalis]